MTAIVFDFDGVMVDSEPMHEVAIRAALLELGMNFSPHDYRTRYLGFADRDIYSGVAAASGRTLTPTEVARLSDLKWSYSRREITEGRVPVFPGSVELLKAAAARGPVAICSGARRDEIELILAKLGIADLVQVIVTADDVAKSKPDPEPYRLTAKSLGLPAAACVAIEDTDKGIKSALAAGLKVVAVCHSMTPQELAAAHQVMPATSKLTVESLLSLVAPSPA